MLKASFRKKAALGEEARFSSGSLLNEFGLLGVSPRDRNRKHWDWGKV